MYIDIIQEYFPRFVFYLKFVRLLVVKMVQIPEIWWPNLETYNGNHMNQNAQFYHFLELSFDNKLKTITTRRNEETIKYVHNFSMGRRPQNAN